MTIADKAIHRMLEEQNKLNVEFANMPEVRVDQEMSDYYPEDEFETISRTEIHQDGTKVELRRFIDRKLYKVVFTNGIEISEIIKWFDLEDTKFKLCGK